MPILNSPSRRIRTHNLSIRNRMPYHWATAPRVWDELVALLFFKSSLNTFLRVTLAGFEPTTFPSETECLTIRPCQPLCGSIWLGYLFEISLTSDTLLIVVRIQPSSVGRARAPPVSLVKYPNPPSPQVSSLNL